jgi:hypothetical protein
MGKFDNAIKELSSQFTKDAILEIEKYFKTLYNPYKSLILYLDRQGNRFDLESIKMAELRRKEFKHSVTSLYDEVYISYRDNISIDEAKLEILRYKKNKATSKTNFIKKHGLQRGTKKFIEFQLSSASSSENIKQKLGSDKAWMSWNRERSRRCPEFYIKKGIAHTYEEATKLVSEYQLNTAGVNRRYYENLGIYESEIHDIIEIIRSKQVQHSRNRKFLKEKHGKNWKEYYEIASTKYRLRMEELKVWLPLDILEEWEKYKRLVLFYTRSSTKAESDLIEGLENRSSEFHLDHIFSIKHGFVFNVDPKIIGSPINLRIITRHKNCSKSANSDISLEELLDLYENYKNS